jgi:hypothetical protein
MVSRVGKHLYPDVKLSLLIAYQASVPYPGFPAPLAVPFDFTSAAGVFLTQGRVLTTCMLIVINFPNSFI